MKVTRLGGFHCFERGESVNQKRRRKLATAKDSLNHVDAILNAVLDEESDSLNNWPESLEGTDRYQESEAACDCLEDALSMVADATEILDRVISRNL